jgi:hypothetical protein
MKQAAGFLVGILALTIAGCATPAPSLAPPGVDVGGTWAGTWSFENPEAGTGNLTLVLRQAGADVAGNATVTTRVGTRSTYFEGLVTGNTVILKPPHASGTLTISGDEMSGVVEGIMPATVSLRRQK